MDTYKIIEVKESVFADNDREAARVRQALKQKGTFLLNLMSSPGSGKTTTLLRTIETLKGELRMGVMEADIDSDVDAAAIAGAGVRSIQLHTGGMCHLDAGMTEQGLREIGTDDLDLVVLENVGNLVCPAEFDTGAVKNAMILSVPEGHDKPLKYPLIFTVCDVLLINKTDVLPYFDFDMEKVIEYAHRRNPKLEIFPVSAKTGEGVDELLEMILLQADTMELRANPNRLGRGVIIEAKLDKARGPLATVLMQNGTLHVGDNIIAGLASGRVRALINDRGEKVKEAGPSTPVEIMGFDEVPSAGDEMQAVGDDRLSRQVAEERKAKVKASREATMAKVSLENMFSNMESGKQTTLNLIIKADVQGSVEAVKQAMEKLSSDEVKVHVLHSAAGAITKDDVNLASAFNAIIIGFNIRPDASAREAAEREKVDVRLYTVIYKAIEDMELAMKGLLAPEYREVLLGHAEVRNVFKITGAGVIAGCYVTDGKVQRNAQVRLLRDNVVVFEGKLSSLKHYKEDVKEMAAGFECGMSLEGHNDIKEGDVVECFIMEEIPR